MSNPQSVPGTSGRPAAQRGDWISRRALAFALDTALVGLVVLAIGEGTRLVFGPAFEPHFGSDGSFALTGHPLTAQLESTATVLAGITYFVASWRLFGATPAQRVFGLLVRTAQGDGSLSTLSGAFRWIGLGGPLWIASAVAPGIVGLASLLAAPMWMLVLLWTTARSPTGQGIHDRWARSIVIRAEGKRDFGEPVRVR